MSLNLRNKKFDLIYIEGPGDLVESFRRWYNKEDVITETSRTFSGQFFDFCWLIGFGTWKLRNIVQRKPDNYTPYLLRDFFVNSIFSKGFKMTDATKLPKKD